MKRISVAGCVKFEENNDRNNPGIWASDLDR